MQNFKEFPLALSYDDVIIVPKYSEIDSRAEVDLSTKISKDITLNIPLISINMDTVTGVEMAIAMGKAGGLGFLPRFDAPEVQADKVKKVKEAGVLTAAAIGCKNGYKERAEVLVLAGADILTLDVAHGHMKKSLEATLYLKNRYKDVTLISGVVATYEGAKSLFEAGADCVRVGVGPGTICTTRIVTGVGVPQITALLEASKAAREFGKTILADGGTRNSGDIVKGLAAGASAIVSGSQLAGTDEAPGDLIEIEGIKYKTYNASTSVREKNNHIKKYKDDKDESYVLHIEGVEAYVHYKGRVQDVINRLMAGVRSGLSYCGARNIPQLWKNANFMRVTAAGLKESGAHNVIVSPQNPHY